MICLRLPLVRASLHYLSITPLSRESSSRLCPIHYRFLFCCEHSVRIAGGLGAEPLPHLADPLPLVKIRPWGSSFNPHLSFAEVGMLLDSHFLLMQFLKYLGLHHDDLNVTTS